MCQHFTLMAKSSDHRYLLQCEHGTLHLIWHHAAMQFPLHDFLRLARFLDTWTDNGTTTVCDGFIRLYQSETGNVQLWLSGVGVYLTPFDMLSLTDMAQTAAARIAGIEQAPTLRCQSLTMDLYRVLEVAPQHVSYSN
jgi:hypothetical protein